MTKVKFYTFFSIFNILLITLTLICTIGGWFLLFEADSVLEFFSGAALPLIAMAIKILLPYILSDFGQKHKNSIIDKFLLYMKENLKEKKQILLFAFIFDLPFILYSIYTFEHIVLIIFSYFFLYLGGLFLFYKILFFELETYK